MAPEANGLESIYTAMVVGLRDYVGKNHFPGVVIGLSGGIDSALTAAVAIDALGAEKVHCVMMPSSFTSTDSREDATDVRGKTGDPPRYRRHRSGDARLRGDAGADLRGMRRAMSPRKISRLGPAA